MKQLSWYQAKGSGHQGLDDAHYYYLKGKSGLAQGSINDHTMAMLTALGFTTGSLNDRLRLFYAAKTGLSVSLPFSQLENSFYANTGFDFV